MEKSSFTLTHSSSQKEENGHTIFNRSKQRFYHAIKWNTIEAVLYHILYLCHQLALYAIIDTPDYGKYAALISFSFLCVPVLMGALDMALIPHMKKLVSNKGSFKGLIYTYVLPQCALMFLMPFILYTFVHYKLTAAINYLSLWECLFVGIFIACEASKKLLRRILHLLFYNRYTAAVEVASISVYMALFWGAVFWGIKPSLFLVIAPFLIGTVPALIFFGFVFYNYYQTLPEESSSTPLPSIFATQVPALANQISRSLFSSNLLIPLFTGWIGFTQAGIAALAKNITYTLTYFLHKICSPTAAFLSDTKDLGEKKQKDAFVLSIKIFCIVSLVSIFGLLSYNIIYKNNVSLAALFYMCFFFVVHLLEHLFTLYEKFFTSQKRGGFLLACNIISCFGAVILFTQLRSLNFFTLIMLIFSLRIFLLIGLSYLIFLPKYVPILAYWYNKHSKKGSRWTL